MIWMISNGFGMRFFKDYPLIGPVSQQFTHAGWHGMNAWDLIQPFFMFIVGVAMPFAFLNRTAAGEPWSRQLRHVLRRCFLLIVLGTIARSLGAGKPVLDLINVLAQIAFTYFVAFLVLEKSWRAQAAVAGALLAAHTLFYLFVTAPGVTGPWDQDANIGWWIDGWALGKHWGGGYATINCVSSAANTVFGLMAGWLLIGSRSSAQKIKILLYCGVAGIAAGLALDPFLPIVKKIWTASFALYSAGYTLLALALFHWLFDVKRIRRATAIFAMVGANSIFIYLFHEIMYKFLERSAGVFTGWMVDLGGPFGQMATVNVAIAFQIYLCCWLYRRKIFFKL
jgi:predicted acyltransferase